MILTMLHSLSGISVHRGRYQPMTTHNLIQYVNQVHINLLECTLTSKGKLDGCPYRSNLLSNIAIGRRFIPPSLDQTSKRSQTKTLFIFKAHSTYSKGSNNYILTREPQAVCKAGRQVVTDCLQMSQITPMFLLF